MGYAMKIQGFGSLIRVCLRCKTESIISLHFKNYVCDACYKKNQEDKKNDL
jgi:hypothetical protein